MCFQFRFVFSYTNFYLKKNVVSYPWGSSICTIKSAYFIKQIRIFRIYADAGPKIRDKMHQCKDSKSVTRMESGLMISGPNFGLQLRGWSRTTETKKPKTKPGPGIQCSTCMTVSARHRLVSKRRLPISPDDVKLMSPNLIHDHDPAQNSNLQTITTQILQFPAQFQLSFDHNSTHCAFDYQI